MSSVWRMMALLSGDGGKERHDKHDRWEDVDREEEYDRKRKPYDARKGYQRRDHDHARRDEADEWEPQKLTKSGAEAWVRRMQNSDGSSGAHWDYNQTEQVRQQKGYRCDPVAFFAAMNMMYSDYCQTARDIGCNTVDFYAAMAHAFMDDADAPKDKIERYIECVAGA